MRAIYSLVDPRDNHPFYVGQTSDVTERFIQHLRCDGSNYRKDERIQELKNLHMLPIMVTLEVVDDNKSRDREAYWIHHYQYLGIHLCNGLHPNLEYRTVRKRRVVVVKHRSPFDGVATERFQKIREMRETGKKSKVEILKTVYGVNPGATKAYKQALAEYHQCVFTERKES